MKLHLKNVSLQLPEQWYVSKQSQIATLFSLVVNIMNINTNLVLSDSGATLKFKFCTLKNTTHIDFQLKISTPGILAAIRSSENVYKITAPVWMDFKNSFTWLTGMKKQIFYQNNFFWFRPFFFLIHQIWKKVKK